MSEGYNGYTNYETWVVALHIDNTEGSQNYWHDRARWAVAHHDPNDQHMDARCELAEALKEAFDEIYDEQKPDNGVLADMLRAALSEVNWHELAGHYVDAVTEEV